MLPALKWFENFEPWKNMSYKKRDRMDLKNGYTMKLDNMERQIKSE
tara:strand:- start:255 stop:392 length:138 start_codon:yes stop_codon:yes gene_type:complete